MRLGDQLLRDERETARVAMSDRPVTALKELSELGHVHSGCITNAVGLPHGVRGKSPHGLPSPRPGTQWLREIPA